MNPMLLRLCGEQNWRCCHCRDDMDPGLDALHPKAPSIEHVHPRCLGGSNDWSNLAAAHRECNNAYSHRHGHSAKISPAMMPGRFPVMVDALRAAGLVA